MFERRPSILSFLLIFSLAPSLNFEARAQDVWPRNFAPSITTTGTASVEVVPNIATISFGIETERPTAADAANENARAAQAIVAEIKAQGIDPRDVKTVSVTLTPVYDETRDSSGRVAKRALRGYVARSDLNVRVRQIEKAGALARVWIEKGANSFTGVEYDYDQKESKYDALRGEAVRDALRKATSYVDGLGVKLGRVLEISAPPYPAGGPPQPAVFAKAAPQEAAIAIPIEPGVETLRTEVQVTWELAQ